MMLLLALIATALSITGFLLDSVSPGAINMGVGCAVVAVVFWVTFLVGKVIR